MDRFGGIDAAAGTSIGFALDYDPVGGTRQADFDPFTAADLSGQMGLGLLAGGFALRADGPPTSAGFAASKFVVPSVGTISPSSIRADVPRLSPRSA